MQLPAQWPERLGWLLILIGFPLGNTTVGLAVLAVAALLRLVGLLPKAEWAPLRSDSFERWGWLFLAVSVLSALQSSHVVTGLATSLAFFLLFHLLVRGSAVWVGPKPYFRTHFVAALVLSAALIGSCYAIYTYVGLGHRRAFGLSVEINSWGTVSAFLVLVALGCAVHYWRRRPALATLALVVAGTAFTSLVLTFSRGAWLAFAASLLLLALLRLRTAKVRGRTLLLGLLAAVVGVGLLFTVAPKVQERFLSAFSFESNMDRIVVWEASVKMIADNPWFGVGGGAFPAEYDAYRVDGRSHTMSFAHNIVLHMAAEFGILGLIPFAALVGTALWRGWTVARRSGTMIQALYAGYVGILLHDLVDNITYGMNVGGLFWFLTGLFVHLHRSLQASEAAIRKSDEVSLATAP